METRVLLNILIFMSSLFYVHCCGRQSKTKKNCPNPGSLTQCAMLYTDYSCIGRATGVKKDQDHYSGSLIHSAVVKSDCRLTIRNDVGDILDIEGVNGELGSVDIDALMCSCNEIKGCPNPRYLKPLTRKGKQMCAFLYPRATDDSFTSCFGLPVEAYNGESAKKMEKVLLNDAISAIVVRDGCTLKGYEHENFGGTRKNFTGVTSKLGNMNNHISSYICKCEFPALESDCNPSESWKKITICSNPDKAEMTCKFSASYGFTTGSTSTTDHGVTENIELSFGVQLKEIFNVGITSNTGYSWKTSTAFSKSESEETKYNVDFKVPIGETYALYQLWGHCGQSDVKTKYFEVRNERTAEVIEHKGVKQPKMQDLQLRTVNFTAVAGEAGGTSSYNRHTPADAFNGKFYWHSGEPTMPQAVWFHFDQPIRVKIYYFESRGADAVNLTPDGPSKYEFFGSNGEDCRDQSKWVVLKRDNTGTPFTSDNYDRTGNVNHPDFYTCYGFHIKEVPGRSYGKDWVAIKNVRFWYY